MKVAYFSCFHGLSLVAAASLMFGGSAHAAATFDIFSAGDGSTVNNSTFITSTATDSDPTPEVVTTTLTRNTGTFGAANSATGDTIGASGGNAAVFDTGSTGGVPNEQAIITFDKTVEITSLTLFSDGNVVRSWSSGDSLYIQLPGGVGQTITFASHNSNVFSFGAATGDFTGDVIINAGESIVFGYAAGSGRLDAFAVEVIPEPASLALMSIAGLLMLSRRRKAVA